MFVPLAVVAIMAQFIRMIWKRVPEYFQQPLDVTSALLSVVMVVFALPLITSSLSLREFEVLLVLALVQYGLLFYQHRKLEYEIVWRVMAAVLVAVYVGHDVAAQDTSLRVAGWMLAAMTLIGGSLLRWNTTSERRMVEVTMAWIGTAVLWLAACVALFSTPLDAWLSLACLFVVIGSAAALSYRHDDRSYMYSAVIATLFVPAIMLRALGVAESLRVVTLGWYCLVISAIGMMIYGIAARQMPRTKFWLLTAIVLHVAYGFAVAMTNVQELALTLYFVLAAVFFYQVAYVERDLKMLYVAAGATCLLVVRLLFDVMGHQWSNWMLIVAVMSTGALHWVAAQYCVRQYSVIAKILHIITITLFAVAVVSGLVVLIDGSIGVRLLTSLAALLLAGALGQYSMSYMSRRAGECAIYAGTSALLYAMMILDETHVISPLVYAHVVAVGIVGAARLYVGEPRTHRYMVAAAIVSFMLTIYALSGGQTYLLLYLVEHALLAVAGAVFRQKWATMGGVVMLIFGMIYMLREVQVILLLMVGLGLIGYVIWRLSRPAK
jgi:hypothetical protein